MGPREEQFKGKVDPAVQRLRAKRERKVEEEDDENYYRSIQKEREKNFSLFGSCMK